MDKVIIIQMDALFPMLFWGSVISLLFLLIYHRKNKQSAGLRISRLLIIARLCHAIYYFVASGRGILPDWLSVSIGNTLLYVGYYYEARSVLSLIKENSRFTDRLLLMILLAFCLAFNITEFFAPFGGIRIMNASLGVVALMVLPCARMLLSRDASAYAKPVAAFYAVYLVLLLMRAWTGFNDLGMGILTNNILQSITFLSMMLQLIVALPAYVMIMNGYANEALVLMATTDKVTGATNRHAFVDAASAVFNESRSKGLPLSLLFLDIDRFKLVNDKYGHAFGDVVLARLAALMDTSLRKSDLSCRYGGEEFVMMLNESPAAAGAVAERIISECREQRFEEQPDFRFTVSIGVASIAPDSPIDFEKAVSVADEAMYRAKREGRDRVVAVEV